MNAASVALQQQRPTANRRPVDRDELLQLSRRIDWRFLLPDPELAHTAVLAGADLSLIESLQRISELLTILDSGSFPECAGRFSLVVACNPSREQLVRAVQATRGGGFVYVEVNRSTNRSSSTHESRSLRRLQDWQSALSRLHVTGLQAHWHWPNFDVCTDIVPLSDTAAGLCTLRRRGTSLRSRWKSRFAALLLRLGLLPAYVPCFSILGQRFQQEDSSARPNDSRGL